METKFAVGRLVLSCAAVAMSGLLAAGAAQAESVTKVYQSLSFSSILAIVFRR